MAGDRLVELGIAGLERGTKVGEGGNATVFRARQTALDRDVAVKILKEVDAGSLRRFDRERRAMGRLSQHDGIVDVYESGYTDHGEPYLIMPLLARSLEDELRQGGPIPWDEAVRLMIPVCDAVAYAHREGVVHSDLKPANVMLSSGGRVQVSDFGISRIIDSTASTKATAVSFTPAYSPPEAFDAVPAAPTADVYSLGATLYALLAGHAPFLGHDQPNSLLVLLKRIAEDPVAPLSDEVPGLVSEAVLRSLSKDPGKRQRDASELAAELRSALERSAAPLDGSNGAGHRLEPTATIDEAEVADLGGVPIDEQSVTTIIVEPGRPPTDDGPDESTFIVVPDTTTNTPDQPTNGPDESTFIVTPDTTTNTPDQPDQPTTNGPDETTFIVTPDTTTNTPDQPDQPTTNGPDETTFIVTPDTTTNTPDQPDQPTTNGPDETTFIVTPDTTTNTPDQPDQPTTNGPDETTFIVTPDTTTNTPDQPDQPTTNGPDETTFIVTPDTTTNTPDQPDQPTTNGPDETTFIVTPDTTTNTPDQPDQPTTNGPDETTFIVTPDAESGRGWRTLSRSRQFAAAAGLVALVMVLLAVVVLVPSRDDSAEQSTPLGSLEIDSTVESARDREDAAPPQTTETDTIPDSQPTPTNEIDAPVPTSEPNDAGVEVPGPTTEPTDVQNNGETEIEAVCTELRTAPFEERRLLVSDAEAVGDVSAACADDLARTIDAVALRDRVDRLVSSTDSPIELTDIACNVATNRITFSASSSVDEPVGANIGVSLVEAGGQQIGATTEPLIIWRLEPGESIELDVGLTPVEEATGVQCQLSGQWFLADTSDADASIDKEPDADLASDDPAIWLPRLGAIVAAAVATGDQLAVADIEDVRSTDYVALIELIERGDVVAPTDFRVCASSSEGSPTPDWRWVAYDAILPEGNRESQVGLFRRGGDGQWRWLSRAVPLGGETFTDC